MKIDVLTAAEAKFRRFCWWSDWVDIAVFANYDTGHLLQMRVSRRNAKQFRTVAFKSWWNPLTSAGAGQVEDLVQMRRDREAIKRGLP